MINYIKSELYRIIRMKGIYILAIICGGLLIAMNLVLFFAGSGKPEFPYDATGFSFSMVEGSVQFVFILTLCIAGIIFADEYKNKTLMNSIAFGYSRMQLYFGKMIVSIIVAFVTFSVVLGVFIGSSYLLLENSGTDALISMLKCYTVESMLLICGEVAAITLLFILNSFSGATWAWIGIFLGVPSAAALLGMKFTFFRWLNGWLVYSITGEQSIVEGNPVMIYQTAEGVQKCLFAGALGTLVFLVIGVLVLRKKELK
ncbi:MAG TPA: ABC transporter permease [Lachnospiraceae bacterium]|nr:ABC transporter permease [Lachnospiraceae bacterium]